VSAKLSWAQKQQPRHKLGRLGEHQAAQFLLTQGYKILSHNTRWKQLEVDIIALDSQVQELVFVEVKTRSSATVPGHMAINRTKIKALHRFAHLYVASMKEYLSYRIDVITVHNQHIEHFKDITWWQ
jgi:putative endonuclease